MDDGTFTVHYPPEAIQAFIDAAARSHVDSRIPADVYGNNPEFPALFTESLPEGIAVRVYSAVVWDGSEFVGLTLVRGLRPSEDSATVNRSYMSGTENRTQRLRETVGLHPEFVALFFRLWTLPVIDWKIFDVPAPVVETE